MARNTLVLTSGGILGVTYGGVFRCMEENGISLDSFDNVYGTSVGALVGLLVVCGLSYIEIQRLLMNLPIEKIFQITSQGLIEFADTQGIDRGLGIQNICRIILKRKFNNPQMTLGELRQRTGKTFTVNATDVCTGEAVLLGTNETPQVYVEDAVLASSAIPFLYSPVRIRNMVLVDGGVSNSLLLHLVPKEDLPNTIAVVPIVRKEPTQITDVPNLAKSVYNTMINQSIQRLIQTCGKEATERVIYIHTPVDSSAMLGESANNYELRRTLDFLGYTEANRSNVIQTFGKSSTPTPDKEPERLTDRISQPTPLPVPDTNAPGSRGPPLEATPPRSSFLPPEDEVSDMSSLPPRDIVVDSSRSLPPPVETRKEAAPVTAPLTYSPRV